MWRPGSSLVRMRLNLIAVVFGIAAGFLAGALMAVTAWGLLLLFVSGAEPTGGIVFGAVAGAFGTGYVAGRFSLAKVFNGAAAGLLYAGAITLLSVLDGSPAPTSIITLFIVVGLTLGGLGGYVAHRRTNKPAVDSN